MTARPLRRRLAHENTRLAAVRDAEKASDGGSPRALADALARRAAALRTCHEFFRDTADLEGARLDAALAAKHARLFGREPEPQAWRELVRTRIAYRLQFDGYALHAPDMTPDSVRVNWAAAARLDTSITGYDGEIASLLRYSRREAAGRSGSPQGAGPATPAPQEKGTVAAVRRRPSPANGGNGDGRQGGEGEDEGGSGGGGAPGPQGAAGGSQRGRRRGGAGVPVDVRAVGGGGRVDDGGGAAVCGPAAPVGQRGGGPGIARGVSAGGAPRRRGRASAGTVRGGGEGVACSLPCEGVAADPAGPGLDHSAPAPAPRRRRPAGGAA